MKFLSKLFKNNKQMQFEENICTDKNSPYYNYPNDLKAWCENRDKYAITWQNFAKYKENINHYYSDFINNGLKQKDLQQLENYCNKYLELVPDLIKSLKEEKQINKDDKMIINANQYYEFVYKKLALAYEKQGDYQKAIEICQKSIDSGFVNDGTKSGFNGRIEKLKKKLNKK